MSTPTTTASLEAIQQSLQSTNDASSEDEDEGYDGEAPMSLTPINKKCDGEGGCGGEFPFDEHGSEFEYTMLCSSCYEKASQPVVLLENTTVVVEEVVGVEDSVSRNDDEDDNAEALMSDDVDGVRDDDEHDDDVEGCTCGKAMGIVLANVRDANIDRYDIVAGTNELAFKPYINHQDNVTRKARKFFEIIPNTTPLLYGYMHFHALLNTTTKRGWLGHCFLKSTKPDNEMRYVLWEIWETRCDRPRYDGIIIADGGECTKVQHLEKWLVENALSSDVDKEFDYQWFDR